MGLTRPRLPRERWLLATLLLISGCAHRYPMPYPATLLAQDSQKDPGRALVHYLSQPSADAAACDLGAASPHVARIDDDLLERLADAVVEGKVSPPLWANCNRALFPHLASQQTAFYVPLLGKIFSRKLGDADANPAVASQLSAIAAVLADRPVEAQPAEMRAALQPLASRLRSQLDAKERLGPAALGLGRDLLATLELGIGVFDGKPVDDQVIDAMIDQAALRRFMVRLPNADLRGRARARVIHLRVAESTRPEVRARAAEVEQAVSRTGRWAPDPAAHPIARAWFRSTTFTGSVVLVRQNVTSGRAALLAASGSELLGVVPLGGELLFDLTGFAEPVTLCESADRLAVEPCVEAARINLGSPGASVDGDGVLHFSESLSIAEAIALLEGGSGLLLKPTLDGRELTRLELPLRFERPPNLLLCANAVGQRGPDLLVQVQPWGGRLIFSVSHAPSPVPEYRLVLENADAPSFTLASVGANGAAGFQGTRGHDGSPGYPGMSASCPGMSGGRGGDGGPGGRGGDGGRGGNGGDGGTVHVELACGGPCPELVTLMNAVVKSIGGAGGAGGTGGMGGSGGDGGTGGSGSSCYSNGHMASVSGGMSGNRGMDGARGNDGPPGSLGNAGMVTITAR